MKSLKIFGLFTLLFLGAMNLSAQVDVTLNPINALWGKYSLGADITLTDNLSVEPTISYLSLGEDDGKYTGVPANLFLKYYFNPNNGADRFYADVWLRYVNRKFEYNAENQDIYSDVTQTRFGVGFGVGYKVVSKGGFVFDIGFGTGRAIVDNNKYLNDELQREDFDWPDIMFAGKLGIGYRF